MNRNAALKQHAGGVFVSGDCPRRGGAKGSSRALERFPISWNQVIDQSSLKTRKLEQFAIWIDRELL